MNEPKCTCDEGRATVCHQLGTEPHYAGCPRWGFQVAAPLPPDPADVTDADRAKAESVTTAWETAGTGYGDLDERIATALAAERAAVARPVLALAEEIERPGSEAARYLAARLRRALAGPDDARQDGAR